MFSSLKINWQNQFSGASFDRGLAEAACNGVLVLYLTRHDWPEEPYLVQWLQKNVACVEVDRVILRHGEIGAALEQLWSLPVLPRPAPSGAAEAAKFLLSHFL